VTEQDFDFNEVVSTNEVEQTFPMVAELVEVMKKYGFRPKKYGGYPAARHRAYKDRSMLISVDLPPAVVNGVYVHVNFVPKRR